MLRLRFAALAALAAFGLDAGQALAATATATFNVSATVIKVCAVSANSLNFGNYDPTAGTATDGTTTLSVLCTRNTGYNVGLSAGLGSGATIATRKMTLGSDTINYSLYQDAARTTLWGTTAPTETVGATAGIAPAVFTVYGRIPAGQNVPVGTYNDTITVTVTY